MKAEKLFLGNFITMDEVPPVAEAVTVVDGRIQYVGSEEIARTYCDENTEVVDYTGKYIYPGFIEAHAHPLMAGSQLALEIDLNASETLEEAVEIVREFIAEHPEMKAYKGAGWKNSGRAPHKSMLDAICTDKPIYLSSVDGHSGWCNSKAIEVLELGQDTVDTFGKEVCRVDDNGELIGYMSEGPHFMAYQKTTSWFSAEDICRGYMVWQDFMFRQGYTAVCDCTVTEELFPLKQMLADNHKIKLRDYSLYLFDEQKDADDIPNFVSKVVKAREEYNGEYFSVPGLKIFLDGVTEAGTAWMLEPYDNNPGYTGNKRFADHDKMVELFMETAKNDMFVHIHSLGDGATKFLLDCLEEARAKDGRYDQRNAVAHLENVREEDVLRFARLNVTAVVPPLWTPMDAVPQKEVLIPFVGEERYNRAYPIRRFIEAGAMINFHTDYPVSPNVSIPMSIYTAVTRKLPESPKDRARGVERDAISVYQSLRALSIDCAKQLHQQDNMGSLSVGKLANMVVYDQDFLTSDIEKIPDAVLLATIVDGEIVYAR